MSVDLVGPRRWWTLVVVAAAVSLIVIDGTIVNVALPVIINDLKLVFTQAEWVNTIYSLLFAGLLLGAGALGDRWGRQRMLVLGVAVFVVASVLAGQAQTPEAFILARAVQGIGGAFALPSTLSTVNATFRGKDRAIAFGVWGSVIAGMAAVGPLLGGFLTTDVNWRWVFWINVPLGIAIIIGALLVVPNTRGDDAGFDVAGFLLSALGMAAIVFGLVEGQTYGWWTPARELTIGAWTWGTSAAIAAPPVALAAGLALLGGFVAWALARERDGRPVLLRLSLFAIPTFRWGNLAAMIIALGEFGLLFVLPLYLQYVLGMDSLGAGWVLMSLALGALVAGGSAGQLAKRMSAATTSLAGIIIEALAVALLALVVRADSPAWQPTAVLVLYGIGLGLTSAQLTSVALHDVPTELSGQASAAQSTLRQLGSALGVAILGSVLSGVLQARVPGSLNGVGIPGNAAERIEQAMAETGGAVLHALRSGTVSLPKPVADQVIGILAGILTDATRVTLATTAGFLVVAALGVWRLRGKAVVAQADGQVASPVGVER